jgi:hypothetical protein
MIKRYEMVEHTTVTLDHDNDYNHLIYVPTAIIQIYFVALRCRYERPSNCTENG